MTMRSARLLIATAVAVGALASTAGCSSTASAGGADRGKVVVVGAENEYADVAAQIGGKYVRSVAVMSDPNTDPHTFEASAAVAKELAGADLVIQNGVGYDSFMAKLEKASPKKGRAVVDAQKVLGLPDGTPNPHLWYRPGTMTAVAAAVAHDLGRLKPSKASYFSAKLATFEASLEPWTKALATFKQEHGGTPVAVTEPVADYMLQAAGVDIKTPWTLQAAIMNDTDPSPQDAATQDSLFTRKAIKVFLYNQQVTDSITARFLTLARANHIPVVGVYETMPTGYTYQRWMTAELDALRAAITEHRSTEKL